MDRSRSRSRSRRLSDKAQLLQRLGQRELPPGTSDVERAAAMAEAAAEVEQTVIEMGGEWVDAYKELHPDWQPPPTEIELLTEARAVMARLNDSLTEARAEIARLNDSLTEARAEIARLNDEADNTTQYCPSMAHNWDGNVCTECGTTKQQWRSAGPDSDEEAPRRNPRVAFVNPQLFQLTNITAVLTPAEIAHLKDLTIPPI